MSKLNSFLHGLHLVAGPVLAAVGVPAVLIPIIQHGILDAEIASAARPTPFTGAEKKALVLDALATGIAGANAAKPGAIDPAVTGLVDKGIDVVVGTVNAINRKPIA